MLRVCAPFLVTVEGNISIGKSELLSKLAHHYNVVFEPDWTNYAGTNCLEKYYLDPTRHGYFFNSLVQLTMTKAVYEINSPLIIAERSLDSSIQVFVKLGVEKGRISANEATLLKDWWGLLKKNFNVTPHKRLYIRGQPSTCLARVKTRQRAGEEGIDLNLLSDLHLAHDNWLLPPDADTIVINGDLGKTEVYLQCKSVIDTLVHTYNLHPTN